MIGVPDDEDTRVLMRACGLRELTSGIGILTQPGKAGWLTSRVGGDAMDLTLLAMAFGAQGAQRERVGLAAAAVAGVTVLDVMGMGMQRPRSNGHGGGQRALASDGLKRALSMGTKAIDVQQAITVNRPADVVYRFWHNLENLPRFMSHLESVTITGGRRSRWRAKAPAGLIVEWDAEITHDQINERIAWRSLAGADVENEGTVRFVPAPGDRGTEVHVQLKYHPPGGAVGRAIAKLFGQAPEQKVRADLRKLKQVLETGEVVQSDASIHTRPHSARPAGRDEHIEVLTGSQAAKGGMS